MIQPSVPDAIISIIVNGHVRINSNSVEGICTFIWPVSYIFLKSSFSINSNKSIRCPFGLVAWHFVEDARLLPDYRLVHLTSLSWTGALDY